VKTDSGSVKRAKIFWSLDGILVSRE
jgi:hypothetical protein